MNVNATILVQIINFGIAYSIVRFLLLRPASVVLQEQKQHRDTQEHVVQTLRDDIQELHMTHTVLWRTCQEYSAHHTPKQAVSSPEEAANLTIEPVVLSEQEKKERVFAVYNALLTALKVRDV